MIHTLTAKHLTRASQPCEAQVNFVQCGSWRSEIVKDRVEIFIGTEGSVLQTSVPMSCSSPGDGAIRVEITGRKVVVGVGLWHEEEPVSSQR